MPKGAQQIPPVLELFRVSPGNYSLRLFDTKDNYIAVKLAELISDLSTLQVITPNDMKFFRFDAEDRVKPNGHAPEATGEADGTQADEATESEATEAPRRGRGRPRKSSAEREDRCMRCGGSGQVQTLMEGGAAAEGMCPVCQGEGKIVRFGAQR